jgi:GT2 family glycosyltransferase
MQLSIIIVCWNVRDELLNCLRSIFANPPGCVYEIIVIDNASSDGTVDAVNRQFPAVKLIANNENRGFAAANNQGIEVAHGRYIFFLNPDTVLKNNSIDILLDYMEHNTDVGACSPRLLFEDGRIQKTVRRFPSYTGALHRHTFFKVLGIFKPAYNKWLMKDFSYNQIAEVEQVIGAALMVRKEVLDNVGPMDEKNFFMYYEEVDLCYRIKQAEWRVMFVPDAEIVHLAGRSSGQVPVEKTIMAMTSLLRFFKKHRSRFSSTLFSLLFKSAFVLNEITKLIIFTIAYAFGAVCFSSAIKRYAADKLKRSAGLLKISRQKGLG